MVYCSVDDVNHLWQSDVALLECIVDGVVSR